MAQQQTTGLKVNELGSTGLRVTQLCFGALPIGPNQLAIPIDKGAEIIGLALDSGVNFIDTAQSYKTYDYIEPALAGRRDQVVIASKSQAATYEDMEKAIKEALAALRIERIGIFHLHAARVTPEVFEQRAGAMRCLAEAKKAGIVQSVAIATHSVTTARAAADRDDIDIIMPIINVKGLGILHGTRDDMAETIRYAARQGKGLYAMKVFGGGNLLDDMRSALQYVLDIPELASMAVGMVSRSDVEANVRIFSGVTQAPGRGANLFQAKTMNVMSFCQGCGTCVTACPNLALEVVGGKAVVDRERCLLCGYCAPVCPQFAIRVV